MISHHICSKQYGIKPGQLFCWCLSAIQAAD